MPLSHRPIPDRHKSIPLPKAWSRWRWQAIARQVLAVSETLQTATEDELRQRAMQCRARIKLAADEGPVIVEVFALVREIAGRVLGIRHHPVQILGALAMSHGWIAEMRTGEGKTLASLMTVILLGLKSRGCHVFTVNEYLAARDCDFGRPVLEWFGMMAAALKPQLSVPERVDCYRADVTYGSEKEFGFDFLRDQLNRARPVDAEVDAAPQIQNGHAHAVIDEADSILIDQASTPLIISCPQPATLGELKLFHWCEQFSGELTAAEDFLLSPRQHAVRLTQRGCRKLRLIPKPNPLGRLPVESIFTQMERVLAARHFFRENHEYLVIEDRVEIIDQGTGRVLPGRKWQDGLQQAIEIQAGLTPSDTLGSAARITIQCYLKNYDFLCGMTGTADEARRELSSTYGLRVMSIATHRPCLLQQLATRVFSSSEHKWAALIAELQAVVAAGRAVLVGTTSIDASEHCAAQLRAIGLEVQVLHAKHHLEESELVRNAGQPGRITVATNMAGRGTDIKLHPDVRQAGGLHVILSEMNRAARIDRQLAGRAARQGDPGSYQIFVSLDDALLTVLGPKRLADLKKRAGSPAGGELSKRWIRYFREAQQSFEGIGVRDRSQLLKREQQQSAQMEPLGLDLYTEFLPEK